ncbi:hypothetical protein MMPV_008095 [Pyropia vietnamensis]
MCASPAFVGAAAAAASSAWRPTRSLAAAAAVGRLATPGAVTAGRRCVAAAAAAAAASSAWTGSVSAVVRPSWHHRRPHSGSRGGDGRPHGGPRALPRADASDLPPLPLSEAAVEDVLVEAREVLGTMFGSSAQNRDIGITGDVTLVDVDGPFVTLRLSGRFWHKRTDVLSLGSPLPLSLFPRLLFRSIPGQMARVATYLQSRIPEIADVSIESPDQLDEHAT